MSGVVSSIGSALGSVAKVALPVAAAVFTGGAAAAAGWGAAATGAAAGAAAGAVGGLVSGGGISGALKGAVGGGLTGGLLGGISGMMTPTATVGDLGAALQSTGQATSVADGISQAEAMMRATGQSAADIMTGIGVAPGSTFATNYEGVVMAQAPTGMLGGISSGGVKDALGNLIGGGTTANTGGLLSNGMNLLGGYLSGTAAKDAATTSALAQTDAARIAADAAKFRPVGVTTNFGASKFGYDANGNLNSAGYTLSPQLQSQQNQLMGMSGQLLDQYQVGQTAVAPMAQAAQTMFGLGNSYLSTTPQQQAQQYMNEQQALLAAPRANQLADIQARLNAQGRGGLAVGGNAGQMASNPELAAYYNALQQQDLGLAAQATQGGMDYAKFGGSIVGLGGDMLNSMYGTQSAAFDPYQTALGGAKTLEGLGQNAMDLGINLGKTGAVAGGNAGMLLGTGMRNAALTMQDVNKISPWGTALQSGAQMVNQYNNPNYGMPTYNPNQFRLVPMGQ